MKFHSISALLIIVIIHVHDGLAIFEGSPATDNTFNWVVKIDTIKSTKGSRGETFESSCTGAIISELHILTAAHCFRDVVAENIDVYAGGNSISTFESEHRVSRIHQHPQYGMETMTIQGLDDYQREFKVPDIAVLTLKTPLVFGEKIAKVSIPSRQLDLSSGPVTCKIAGWGRGPAGQRTQRLLWTLMSLGDERTYPFNQCNIRHKTLCGVDPQRLSYLTAGDSGGVAKCEDYAVGVAIATVDSTELPVLFHSVFNYAPFIHGIMGMEEDLLDAIHNPQTETISKSSRPRRTERCVCM